jgi:hypothetical protein
MRWSLPSPIAASGPSVHKFVSDISGQDVREHRDRPNRLIGVVRDFLRTESGLNDIPGDGYISTRYRRFQRDLPEIARVARLNPAKLTYVDYCETIKRWLDLNADE